MKFLGVRGEVALRSKVALATLVDDWLMRSLDIDIRYSFAELWQFIAIISLQSFQCKRAGCFLMIINLYKMLSVWHNHCHKENFYGVFADGW